MTPKGRHRHSFVFRIWRDADSPEWKGWVQHANSGASTIIDSFADLLAFIEYHKEEHGLLAVDEPLNNHTGNSNLI